MTNFDSYKQRCEILGLYLAENETTVRKTAAHFNISKSTVHKDIREKLKYINYDLYLRAVSVLDKNKNERHIRGGIATRNKYLAKKHK